MTEAWERRSLGECADIVSGGTPSKSEPSYWNGDIPWVSAKDMKSFRLSDTQDHLTVAALGEGYPLAPADATLLLVRGMTLHREVPVCLARREMAFNQDVKALIARAGVERRFLAYALLARKDDLLGQVDAASHGTGRIQTDVLRKVELAIPPMQRQREVVALFTALDEQWELNARQLRRLRRLVRLIFDSMFGGDRGIATRRLADIATFTKGVSYRSEDLRESDAALFTLKCFTRDGEYQARGLKPYAGRFDDAQRIRAGDVLVAQTDITQNGDVIGRALDAPRDRQLSTLVASLDVAIVRPATSSITPEFLLGVLDSSFFHAHAKSYANGSTVLHLGARALPDYQIRMPEPQDVARFSAKVRDIIATVDLLRRQAEAILQFRDVALRPFMAGITDIGTAAAGS